MADLRASYDNMVYEGEPSPTEYKANLARWPRNRYDALIRLAGRGRRILDVGCGNGLVLYQVHDRFEELHGLELSPNRARSAEAALNGLKGDIRIEVGSIEERTPWPDGHFDVIVSADVVEHIVDLWAGMREVSRLLSPGGRLVVSTPNIAFLPRRLALLLGKFPSTSAAEEGFRVQDGDLFDGGHVHYFTIRMIERLYLRFGIEPVERFGYGRFGRLQSFFPSLLSGAALVVGRKTDLATARPSGET